LGYFHGREGVDRGELSPELRQPDRPNVGGVMDKQESIWLSRMELAQRLGVPVKTPAEWATKGTGPRYARFGKHVRYQLVDVVAWEKSQFVP
jgi:hypothetical protein